MDDGGAGEAFPWERSPIPAEHQIRGLGPILLSVPDLGPTDALRDGDSGTPIIDPWTGEQLGIFVGASRIDDRVQHLYVQCVSRLAANRLAEHGIEVEYYARGER